MTNLCRAVLALFAAFSFVSTASAWDRGKVERFAVLPAGAPNPEGIAVDRHGDVYVTGFDPTGKTAPGKIFVFDDDGSPKRVVDVIGSSSALLGLAFHPTGKLLVIDFGAGNVLDVNPYSGAATVFSSIPGGGLNALTFDSSGNVYISDSFRGIVWKTGPAGGPAVNWASDPLLTTTGYPPFGANGLDFNREETALFVANTGNDTVVRIPVVAAVAGKAEVFTNSINGADGLFVDRRGNVWVCANQADEIVVTDKTGKAIAKLGDFGGLSGGSPVGLLFPASLARHGDWVYITNLSLDLRPPYLTGQQSVDSQWAAQVRRHTISRIPFRIPGATGDVD
jgi:sugar lactone lactonase YvrE